VLVPHQRAVAVEALAGAVAGEDREPRGEAGGHAFEIAVPAAHDPVDVAVPPRHCDDLLVEVVERREQHACTVGPHDAQRFHDGRPEREQPPAGE